MCVYVCVCVCVCERARACACVRSNHVYSKPIEVLADVTAVKVCRWCGCNTGPCTL